MPRKETFEDKVAKLNKLQSKIEKNNEEMKPTYDAYDKLKAEIDAENERRRIERYTVIAEHVLSVFGKDISAEDFIKQFNRIMTDNRNKSFVEELKRNQQFCEKSAVQNPPTTNSTAS